MNLPLSLSFSPPPPHSLSLPPHLSLLPQLDCCGINNVTDWLNANNSNIFTFPQSCCDPSPPCTSINDVHQVGCEEQVTIFVRDQLLIIAAIGIAFIVGEVSVCECVTVCVCVCVSVSLCECVCV